MAQKANAYALRLGINQDWNTWYFSKDKESDYLKQTSLIRKYIHSISRDILNVKIEITNNMFTVIINAVNISYLTDNNNKKLEKIINEIQKITDRKRENVKVHLIEEKRFFSNAQYIANLIASKIEARVPFRVALRTLASKVIFHVKGVKFKIKGRLDGSEIAKTEKLTLGKVPLSTLSNIIDFSQAEAKTSYGKIGISIWINKGKKRVKVNYFKSNFEWKAKNRDNYVVNSKKN